MCQSVCKTFHFPFAATGMDLESVILGEVSPTEKEKYHMTSLICGKRNDTNELTKQKETHRLRERAYGCQGEGIVREFGMGHVHTTIFSMDHQQGPIV